MYDGRSRTSLMGVAPTKLGGIGMVRRQENHGTASLHSFEDGPRPLGESGEGDRRRDLSALGGFFGSHGQELADGLGNGGKTRCVLQKGW